MPELYEYKAKYLLSQLTGATLMRAVYSQRQVLELMVQFWSDHFNIASSKGECSWLIASEDRDVIRKNALGSFRDLLSAVAKGPAMLWYLDGRVNRKRHPSDKPNENYARELLELHTMGVGSGYKQEDVMEVARCLTGWTVRNEYHIHKGTVEFHPELHDDGPKTVLGQSIPAGCGAEDYSRVIDIVALHPETAQHLAKKLCQRFIADDPAESVVSSVAKSFLDNSGNITATLKTLILSPEFRSTRGNKFRRPFEFITAALRASEAITDGGEPVAEYLVRMGHAPFQYPTPDGYAIRATPWMGTLLWRWNFAVALAENRLHGTHVDREAFVANFVAEKDEIPAILGRLPTDLEQDAYLQLTSPSQRLALLLASPSFQMC